MLYEIPLIGLFRMTSGANFDVHFRYTMSNLSTPQKCLRHGWNHWLVEALWSDCLAICKKLFFPLWSDIRNWIRNIEQHASDNVNKILVGNKADMDESKRVIFSLSLSLSARPALIMFAYTLLKFENHPPLNLSVGCANLQGSSTCWWIWH